MFFFPELINKRGAYFPIWIAATQKGSALQRYLPPRKVREIRVHRVVAEILKTFIQNYPLVPQPRLSHFSLYLSSKLLFGSSDINDVFRNIKVTKWNKEKNEFAVQKSKKTKLKSVRGTNTTGIADHDHDDDDDENVLNWVVASEADLSFFNDNDESTCFIFTNSAPFASITLQEDCNYFPQPEDLRFGDEDTERHPVYSLPATDIYGTEPRVTEIFDEEIQHEENITRGEHGSPIVNPIILGPDEENIPRGEHGSPIVNPQDDTGDFHQQPEFEQTLGAAIFEDVPLQARDKSINDSFTNQVMGAAPALEDNTPDPLFDSLPEHLDGIISPMPPLQDDVAVQDDSHADHPNRDISPHQHVTDASTDELMEQLPDLEDTPRRGRKKRGLTIDRITQIPGAVFIERVNSGAQDTIRSFEFCNKGEQNVNSLLTHPGRNSSQSLRHLIERNFQTHSMPTMDPSQPLARFTQPSPMHDRQTTEIQDVCGNSPSQLMMHDSPRRRRSEEHEDRADPKRMKPSENSNVDQMLATDVTMDVSEQPHESAYNLDDQGQLGVNLFDNEEPSHTQQADFQPRNVEQTPVTAQTQQADFQPRNVEQTPVTAQTQQLDSQPWNEVPIDQQAPVSPRRKRKKRAKQPTSRTEQADFEPWNEVTNDQQAPVTSPSRRGAPENVPTSHTQQANFPPWNEVTNDQQVPITSPSKSREPENVQTSHTQQGDFQFDVAQEDFESQPEPSNIPGTPGSSNFPNLGDDVLHQIDTASNMENGGGGDVPFNVLCPPGSTNKRTAARIFEALLGLQLNGKVKLIQPLDGLTVPPPIIKKLN